MWSDDGIIRIESMGGVNWGSSSSSDSKDKRKVAKPVDVFEEIISEKPKIDLHNLDKQIKIVKERKKVLQSHLRKNNFEHEEMAISYLRARKKYTKYKDWFKWPVTTNDLIKKLCNKYKVRMVGIDSYYRNVPKEGVMEIERFGEAVRCVTNYNPQFKLIIDDGGKEERKDPILLGASPFGNWYYVLGAWDSEVEIVDRLIYGGK